MNSKAIRKQLLAAVAMVLVAAVALGSSTYAWFAANNEVTATGMSVHAQGESGIVIKGESDSAFSTTGTALSAVSSLMPTSTCNLTAWWHAVSDQYDDELAEQAAGKYTNVTDNKSQYVAEHVFTIRSAASDVALTGRKLAVKTVTVTPPTTQKSTNLNKAIRVGVKITTGATTSNPEFYIYAPLAGASGFTLVPNYDSTVSSLTEKNAANSSTDILTLADNTIPANDTGLKATVYVWFEGEDTNCKSSNITASLDNLQVSVVFTAVSTTTGGAQQPAETKVDLSAGGFTVAGENSGTTVAAHEGSGNATYYQITGKQGLSGETLYSSTHTSVTKDSVIVTISDGKAQVYGSVIKPTT